MVTKHSASKKKASGRGRVKTAPSESLETPTLSPATNGADLETVCEPDPLPEMVEDQVSPPEMPDQAVPDPGPGAPRVTVDLPEIVEQAITLLRERATVGEVGMFAIPAMRDLTVRDPLTWAGGHSEDLGQMILKELFDEGGQMHPGFVAVLMELSEEGLAGRDAGSLGILACRIAAVFLLVREAVGRYGDQLMPE